jgi:ferredoxin
MHVQDRVFDGGGFSDPGYCRRRAETLIVAVQCARSAATCFCASMNTGPRAEAGFDIALTELGAAGEDGFLVECGSDRGAAILGGLDMAEPDQRHRDTAKAATRAAAEGQTRTMPPDIPNLLRQNLDHPQWSVVADACLSCANCTLACPTCFCSDVEDINDLSGEHTERWRTWDSCFTADFSYVHGGSVRRSTKSRYRQWMTHKLSSWHDQFGSSGCVGCGRCIAWCPVGIDITAQAAVFAADTETED